MHAISRNEIMRKFDKFSEKCDPLQMKRIAFWCISRPQ
jgi:hypothetical protein